MKDKKIEKNLQLQIFPRNIHIDLELIIKICFSGAMKFTLVLAFIVDIS